MPPCLTHSIIRYWSKVSGPIHGNERIPLPLGVEAIEVGAFWSLLATVGQLTYIYTKEFDKRLIKASGTFGRLYKHEWYKR